jgi:hypothetical protein
LEILPPIQIREGNSWNALNIHLMVFGRFLRRKLFETIGELSVLGRDHVQHDRKCIFFAEAFVFDECVDVVVRYVFVLQIDN